MRKALLSLVFLTILLVPITTSAFEIYCPYCGGYTFSPVYISNNAGFAYNLSGITFVTTLLNLTGTFSYNYSEGGYPQAVSYYIALGQYSQYGTYYIQPVITFGTYGSLWTLQWSVQAWGDNFGISCEEYNANGIIAQASGSSVNLNYLFNLTIKATLNSQGEITSAWVYIANAKTGQVYFNKTINLQYPIPDKQVFFMVEDPLYNGQPVNFPIIPSSNYVFVNALASNSTFIAGGGLPLYNGVEFIMQPPGATAYVVPTFGVGSNYMGTQGVYYYW